MSSKNVRLACSSLVLCLLWLWNFTSGLSDAKQIKSDYSDLLSIGGFDQAHPSVGNIVKEYGGGAGFCAGVLVSQKYILAPLHCMWEAPNNKPSRIRIAFPQQVFDLRTQAIEMNDGLDYAIFQLDTSAQTLKVAPAVLATKNPSPETELVARHDNTISKCHFDRWNINGALFSMECNTAEGGNFQSHNLSGNFLFAKDNVLTAFKSYRNPAADTRCANCVAPLSDIVAHSQILKAIASIDTPEQPTQAASAAPPPNNLTGTQAPRSEPSASPAIVSGAANCNPRAADFAGQKCFWEQQIFQCKVGNDIYPSKREQDLYDPKRRYDPSAPKSVWETDYISADHCDDGDMVFFSGLLCAAGDPRGCKGVALAQATQATKDTEPGRWWRSKRLIGQPSEQAPFSTEQGLGVLNYMAKTADKSKFDPWLEYIADVPHTYSPLPSYCPDKECVFKIIDCPLFVTVASRFGDTLKALSVCDPLQYLHLPAPEQIAKQLEDALKQFLNAEAKFENLHKELLDKFGQAFGFPSLGEIIPTPDEELRKQSDLILKTFREVSEQILGPQIGESAARFAQQIALVNSVINSLDIDTNGFKVDVTGKIVYESGNLRVEGANVTVSGGPLQINYNPNGEHIVAVEIFLLRNLGFSSDELKEAAHYAYLRDSSNPFFEYLYSGRTADMRKQIVSKCPSFSRPSVTRFQWFPERGEGLMPNGEPAWIQSMYWDCIFLARLYEYPVTAALSRETSPDPFGGLAGPFGDQRRFLEKLATWSNNLQRWIDLMEPKVQVPGPGGTTITPSFMPPTDPEDLKKHPQDLFTPGFRIR